MGYRIGTGLAIIRNEKTEKDQLCLINNEDFISVATFSDHEDAQEVFKRIAEIQGISSQEAEILELFRGTSESMKMAIRDILRVTQIRGRSERVDG